MQPPPRWGRDDLTAFWDAARQNAYATYVRGGQFINDLEALDKVYFSLAETIVNAGTTVESMFLIRSHSAVRTGSYLAACGQSVESFAIGRICLEAAFYAHHVSVRPEAGEIWLSRSTSDDHERKAKNEFKYGNVRESLESHDATLAADADALYQRCIEFGAHPNEQALMASTTAESTESGETKYFQAYLSGNPLTIIHAVKSIIQVGIAGLSMYSRVYKQRCLILGVTDTVDSLRARY